MIFEENLWFWGKVKKIQSKGNENARESKNSTFLFHIFYEIILFFKFF